MTSIVSLLVLGLVLAVPFSEAREQVKVKGAFYSGITLYLFGNNSKVLSAGSDGVSVVYDQNLFGVPGNYNMTAATYEISNFEAPVFIFFGEETIYSGYILDYAQSGGQFARRFPDFAWHGIDGASTQGDVHYFFRGCEYLKKEKFGLWETAPSNVSDLNVPCDVDAAWSDEADSYVLKDGLVWTVNGDIDSPLAIDEYLYQDKWEIV